MFPRKAYTLAMTVTFISTLMSGCGLGFTSGGSSCFLLGCFSRSVEVRGTVPNVTETGDIVISEESNLELITLTGRENSSYSFRYTIEFSRSIITGVDNYFSRFRKDAKDKGITEKNRAFLAIGFEVLNSYFGGQHRIGFKPEPEMLELTPLAVYGDFLNSIYNEEKLSTLEPFLLDWDITCLLYTSPSPRDS